VIGRHVERTRVVGPCALLLELSGRGDPRLWLDAERGTAGLYLLSRDEARACEALAEQTPVGRTLQAGLRVRKHLAGRRLSGLRRAVGERHVLVEAGPIGLALRVSGAPALTLYVDDAALATLGAEQPAWPPPADDPSREWQALDAERLREALAVGMASGRTPLGALLSACPTLGPVLGRCLAASPEWLGDLRERLERPAPHLIAPAPLESLSDAQLAERDAVALAPIALALPGRQALPEATFHQAAARYLLARRRGDAFARRSRAALTEARRALRRLGQLEAHLLKDVAGLARPDALRRQAEALLASAKLVPAHAERVELPDPYDADARVAVELDTRLSGPANADRLFEKARRLERSRHKIEERLDATRAGLRAALAAESRLLDVQQLAELEGRPPAGARDEARDDARAAATRKPRAYLTSRGLSVLVGRGARENHRLTFGVAQPEDLWLHAREVPGAHVILRDPEGRAAADDLREAAELAAYFSDARGQAQVDVHVTRRKHVRAARGGPGRVLVAHSDTLRVAPRDPEGRLRRHGTGRGPHEL
jgi:hypothetical protein